MKKTILLIFLFLLCAMHINYAQTFQDYILEMRGDTAVVKDFFDMEPDGPNSIINAIANDTEAPEGRVYMFKTNGLYLISQQMVSPANRPIRIVGEDYTPLVNRDNGSIFPPIFAGTADEGQAARNGDMILYNNDVSLKNLIAMPAATDASQGWTFFIAAQGASGNTIELDNVLMEHNRWVFVQSNDAAGNDLIINNCYFVNMNGEPCRRNGGVYDNVNNNSDTIWVENSTHVMAQGMMYKFRSYPISKAFFNHNTFVNCSGQLFTTFGFQTDWTVTNNLFINSNVQGYWADPDANDALDLAETDQDFMPMGIINVDTLQGEFGTVNTSLLPADFQSADPSQWESMRKILVDRNGVYWDSRLDQIVSRLNDEFIDAKLWVPQMMTMNSKTQAIFNDNTTWPLLTEGSWIMGGDPNFVDPRDLMTDQVNTLIEWSVAAAAQSNAQTMPLWRVTNIGTDFWLYPDWPVPVDLSYTNTEYLTAALNGFPLGDLNWFPTQKAAWDAQKDAEHAELEAALNEGRVPTTSVETITGPPADFKISQNYPNPFNPSTKITYSLPNSGFVTLKVYNALGQEVATLVNGYRTAQTYEVVFDATDLTSGVYIYSIEFNNNTVSKKMMLLK
jgi:hypothetical protein